MAIAMAVRVLALQALLAGPALAAPKIAEGEKVVPGSPIPVVTLDGAPADLRASLAGGPTLLIFWATWCQPCIHEVPEVRELYHFYAKRGLRVVGVALSWNGDTREKVKQALGDNGIDYPVLFDDEDKARVAFDLRAIPASILVDASGVVRFKGTILPSDINTRIKDALGPGEESGPK